MTLRRTTVLDKNVAANLECSFLEIQRPSTLWGLLINSGYLTVTECADEITMRVRIPNGEVKSEFLKIIASQTQIDELELTVMFKSLLEKDLDGFIKV